MATICPGQDRRYWRPDDIFDVTCGHCGAAVEFFKDDPRRRCRSCGSMIQNPKITLGCAQWCEHAKQCLGYDPRETLDGADRNPHGDDQSLLQMLEDALRAAVRGSPEAHERMQRALMATDEARSLAGLDGVDRRTVLAATMILGASNGTPKPDKSAWARALLEGLGIDQTTAADITDLISAVTDGKPSTPSARLVRDALELAENTLTKGVEEEVQAIG